MKAAFRTLLTTVELDEFEPLYALRLPLVYDSAVLGATVTVPAGFRTDYASVPRILGIYDLAGGKCNKAAVVHDWLYTVGYARRMPVDRLTADRVLREAIVASGYSVLTAALWFAAVRSFGQSHWDQPNQPQPSHVRAFMGAMA